MRRWFETHETKNTAVSVVALQLFPRTHLSLKVAAPTSESDPGKPPGSFTLSLVPSLFGVESVLGESSKRSGNQLNSIHGGEDTNMDISCLPQSERSPTLNTI